MSNHAIFEAFERVPSVGTGAHVFDFLGVATNANYKKGWAKHAVTKNSNYTASYPVVNEHYFDWIALLQSVRAASGTFRMAELGAGWAPWLVRGAFATKQSPAITGLELLGVEADPTHYQWVREHFTENGLDPSSYHLVHGAVASTESKLRFPVLTDPDVNYAASLLLGQNESTECIEVNGFTLESVIQKFSGPVDFVHIDIQGAEYDVIPKSVDLLKDNVKAVMIGTHQSVEEDAALRDLFLSKGWKKEILYSWREKATTEFGEVQFDDGFQFWKNPELQN